MTASQREYILRKTRPSVTPYLWRWFEGTPSWCSDEKDAHRYESREAAEFDALGLEGVEVVEVPCQPP